MTLHYFTIRCLIRFWNWAQDVSTSNYHQGNMSLWLTTIISFMEIFFCKEIMAYHSCAQNLTNHQLCILTPSKLATKSNNPSVMVTDGLLLEKLRQENLKSLVHCRQLCIMYKQHLIDWLIDSLFEDSREAWLIKLVSLKYIYNIQVSTVCFNLHL